MFDKWVSPYNNKKISLQKGCFFDGKYQYEILDGNIPNFIFPKSLDKKLKETKEFYDNRADDYDKYLHLTFYTYNEREEKVRSNMVDLLEINKNSKVLEVACGTGRDSIIIDKRLSEKGELHLTDLSFNMTKKAKYKLKNSNSQVYFCLSNASYLPYPDRYFDALYSFGGLGEFSDIKKFFKEVVRVCKVGAKVVVGDENLPIWLRDTEFGKILANYNKQFLANVPFEDLPIEAREVRCQWIIGGVFYLIDFRVGEGEPYANFDFEIPGIRGGTHKTRYYGQLEGVNIETKELAWTAVKKINTSMHRWLDEIVKREALKILNGNENQNN